jgi:hypothetical protein
MVRLCKSTFVKTPREMLWDERKANAAWCEIQSSAKVTCNNFVWGKWNFDQHSEIRGVLFY